MGLTEYADWSWEEFTMHRLGATQNCSATTKGNHMLTDDVLPETVFLTTMAQSGAFRLCHPSFNEIKQLELD